MISLGSQNKSHSFDLGNVVKIPHQPSQIPSLDLPKSHKSSFTLNIRVVPEHYFNKALSTNSSTIQTPKPNSIGFLSAKKTPESKDSQDSNSLKVKLEEVESNPSTQDGNEENLSLLSSPMASHKLLCPEDYSTPTKDIQQSSAIPKLLLSSSPIPNRSALNTKPTDVTGLKRRLEQEIDSHAIQKKVKLEEGEAIPLAVHKQDHKTEERKIGFSLTKTGFERCKKTGLQTVERKKRLADVIYDNRTQQWLFVLEVPSLIGTQKKTLTERELLAEDPALYLSFYAGYVQRFGV